MLAQPPTPALGEGGSGRSEGGRGESFSPSKSLRGEGEECGHRSARGLQNEQTHLCGEESLAVLLPGFSDF